MSNNCKWYMKGRLYERIKDFSHGKWMASVQHTKYSLCVTEHSTENTPIFFWGWKKERGNKPCYWDPSFFWCNKRKKLSTWAFPNVTERRVIGFISTEVIFLGLLSFVLLLRFRFTFWKFWKHYSTHLTADLYLKASRPFRGTASSLFSYLTEQQL